MSKTRMQEKDQGRLAGEGMSGELWKRGMEHVKSPNIVGYSAHVGCIGSRELLEMHKKNI